MGRGAVKTVEADYARQMWLVRGLFEEYVGSLDFDIAFQDLEKELPGLPGDYAPPDGRILLAVEGDEVAGCIALRKIDEETCEGKRLYVRPAFRGKGAGRALCEAVIGEARKIGYRRMLLDTVESLNKANALYRALGFRGTEPYRYNPLEGAVFMELDLVSGPPASTPDKP